MFKRLGQPPCADVAILNIEGIACGLDRIASIRRAWPLQKIIALLPEGSESLRANAMRMGADVCAWKPCDDHTLNELIRNCLEEQDPHSAMQPGDVEPLGNDRFFVMASPAMRKLRAQVDQVAKTDVPVLILGESGTGKEVVARLIHHLSLRSGRPFLKLNCAALPGELLESELFGYERGAFTGAVRPKPGIVELCNNGTLLLDEIAEMAPALQAKLLHFLQDQEFSRLGSCSRTKVNVRVLAATNVNIKAAILAKTFREDLYYRLGTFIFSVPPLRERKEDIPVLFHQYIQHHAHALRLPPRPFNRRLGELCSRYPWPGNVRELENLAKRYIICGEESLGFAGASMAAAAGSIAPADPVADVHSGDLKAHVRDVRTNAEARAISHALDQANWNRREAARILNISYKSLLSKIRQYGLEQTVGKPRAQYRIDGNGAAYRIA